MKLDGIVIFGPYLSPIARVERSMSKCIIGLLQRLGYQGKIYIFLSGTQPLFKVKRDNVVEEILFEADMDIESSRRPFDLLCRASDILGDQVEDWIAFIAGPVVLNRDISSIILSPPFSGRSIRPDLVVSAQENIAQKSAALPSFFVFAKAGLERLSMHGRESNRHLYDFCHQHGFKIRSLETSVLVTSFFPNIDLAANQLSCLMSLMNWPDEIALSHIRSHYFDKILGDENGIFIELLEP